MKYYRLPTEYNVELTDKPLSIAFIYSRIPLPMERGDQLTVSYFLNYLSKRGHKIDFFFLKDKELDETQKLFLNKNTQNYYGINHTLIQKFVGLLNSSIRLQPFQIGYFYSGKLSKSIRDSLNKNNYDVVYAYYIRSAEYAIGFPCRKVLGMQLSQSLNLERISTYSTNILKKLFYLLESKLMGNYESSIWRKFERVILISEFDSNKIIQCCKDRNKKPMDNHVHIAHGTDVIQLDENMKLENIILFSGNLSYEPNVIAIVWFMKNVYPLLFNFLLQYKYTVQFVGKSPDRRIYAFHDFQNVNILPNVPDIFEFIKKAKVCINPVQATAGMQNKLVEYFSYGKPVVATSCANDGIKAEDGHSILIADNPKDFAQKIKYILMNDKYARILGRNARLLIENKWTWKYHFEKLEQQLYT